MIEENTASLSAPHGSAEKPVEGQQVSFNKPEELRAYILTYCKEFGWDSDLNHIDVSNMISLSGVFAGMPFQGDISQWNVSNVKDMSFMFAASTFNGDLSLWDVSHVEDMSSMFKQSSFDGDISQWKVEKLEHTTSMFKDSHFTGDLSPWYHYQDHLPKTLFMSGKEYENYQAMADVLSKISTKEADYSARYNQLTNPGSQERLSGEQLSKAYYASDLFKERVARSLGYHSIEAVMHSEHKETYLHIVKRGQSTIPNTVVYPVDEDGAQAYFDDDINTSIYAEDKEFLGINDMSHEFAHHLYNASTTDGINPGINAKPTKYIQKPEESYGKEDSPLNTINAQSSRNKRVALSYASQLGRIIQDFKELGIEEKKEFSETTKIASESSLKKFAIDQIKIHDDAGVERAADVQGFRTQMFIDGIWNQFDGSEVTLEQVKAYHKKYPNARIFNYWTEEEVVYYSNHIACNDVKPPHTPLNVLQANANNLLASLGNEPSRTASPLRSESLINPFHDLSQQVYEQLSHEEEEDRHLNMHV